MPGLVDVDVRTLISGFPPPAYYVNLLFLFWRGGVSRAGHNPELNILLVSQLWVTAVSVPNEEPLLVPVSAGFVGFCRCCSCLVDVLGNHKLRKQRKASWTALDAALGLQFHIQRLDQS